MIEQVNITDLTRPYSAAHNAYIVNINDTFFCNTISLIQNNEECSYIKDTEACHEMDFNIDYSKHLYCNCNSKEYRQPCILLLILLGLLYITIIVVTAYTSLAPNIIAIIQHLNLSEFGGTIFAIGFSCCLTGVLEIRYRYKNDTELIMAEVLTTNMHLRGLCAGIFLINRQITLHPLYYTRDQIFYLIGLIITFSFMNSATLHFVAAIIGMALYIFILIIVFVQEYFTKTKKHKEYINAIHYQQKLKYPVISPVEQTKLKINEEPTLFKQFFYSIEPRKLQLAYRSNYWQKMILIIGLPVNTFITLCIPVYHSQLPLNGWSKLLNLLNLFLFPIIFWIVAYNKIPLTFMISYFIAACIIAIYVILKSTPKEPPKQHIIFAYIGNLFCVGLIYIVESELMSLLTTLGYNFELQRQFIGLHLLSVARVIATAVLAATLASWDYNQIAFGIFTFSPIVLTNLAIVILVILKCIYQHSMQVSIRPGVNGYAGVVVLFIEFFSVFAATLFLNFNLRKSLGYYLILVYTVFILIKLLSGSLFIHPLGTDHHIDIGGKDVPWA